MHDGPCTLGHRPVCKCYRAGARMLASSPSATDIHQYLLHSSASHCVIILITKSISNPVERMTIHVTFLVTFALHIAAYAAPTWPKDSESSDTRGTSPWSKEAIFTLIGIFVALLGILVTIVASKKLRRGVQSKSDWNSSPSSGSTRC